MSLRERIKQFRRERIIKAVIAEGLSVPSRTNLRYPMMWPFWHTDYTLENSELIFSAVSRIANALSSMPVQLYQNSKPVNDELNDLISAAPNPSMTSCTFFKSMEACRCSAGACYGLKIYDEKFNLERIDILDPTKVTPVMDDVTQELWFRVTTTKGEQVYIHNFYIIYIPFISTNGYKSVNPVSVLFDTVKYGEDIQRFSRDQLDKGVNAAIVLSAPAQLGENQRKETVNDLMKTYRETRGNILLLESGLTAKSLDLSPIDSKLFEVEKITRSKVAMVYNIPPHLLGDYSGTSFNSQEQQMIEFMMLTMFPIVTAYEQELNRKLLTKEQRMKGYEWKFDMDAILRADSATQAEVDQKRIRCGAETLDEVRARHHKAPYKGGIGNEPMISKDMVPVRIALEAPKEEPPKPPKEPTDEPTEEDTE